MKRLGVKLCGNCNPQIHSLAVAKKIAAALGCELVPYEQGDATLTISGCISSCVFEKYPSPVQIQGLMVNGRPCATESELASEAAALYRRLEKEPENPAKNRGTCAGGAPAAGTFPVEKTPSA